MSILIPRAQPNSTEQCLGVKEPYSPQHIVTAWREPMDLCIQLCLPHGQTFMCTSKYIYFSTYSRPTLFSEKKEE